MKQRSTAHRAQEIQQAIAELLLRRWDPIGVRDEPHAQDEYDGYIGGVYRLLVSGASPQAIAEHLCAVEAEQMGLTGAWPSDLLPVAVELCRLGVRLQEK